MMMMMVKNKLFADSSENRRQTKDGEPKCVANRFSPYKFFNIVECKSN